LIVGIDWRQVFSEILEDAIILMLSWHFGS
jgi:hypothetical protein